MSNNKKERYSRPLDARPEIVESYQKEYKGKSRRELMTLRDEAVARKDWHAMQAITYALCVTF